MKIPTFGMGWVVVGMLMLLPFAVSPTQVSAQCTGSKGNNAVYAGCGLQGSTAFIDAGAFSSSGDICARIHAVLTSGYPASGAVIDARGIRPPGGGSTQLCSTNPWAGITTPSTVLLPSGTIQISVQWALPSGTRIVGEGSGAPGAGVTTVQAASGFANAAAMIKMGTATGATGVSVEDLALDGNGTAVSGISNSLARDLSYVRRLSLSNIAGTGLLISSGAQNSGPYSDINFSSTAASAVCASIQGASTSTRGIHGLTCTGNVSGTALPVAVLLDAPNNTIEDVRVSGFTDGIKLGQNLPTQGDVLSNISGGPNVTSIIHIANAHLVSDLSVVGVAKNGATNAINDQESLPSSSHLIADSSVAIYVLGEQVTAQTTVIGFSRFTTSKSANAPTWATGNAAIASGTACSQPGSLYSNRNGSINGGLGHGNTWYVCQGSPSTWNDVF